jgi:hypothetical protein
MANRFDIKTVFSAQDHVSKSVNKMRGNVSKFTHSMSRGLRIVNRNLDKLATKMGRGFKRGAIALAGAVTSVGVAIKKVADRADSLSKQAKVLDMPIQELQEWQFVAEQSGLTADGFTKSLGILNKQVGQLKIGSGELTTLLAKTDPVLLQRLRRAKDTSEAFNLIIDKLRKIKDPAQRAALAFAAFGRQGLKTVIIAKTSAKAIAALREEARKNGLITQKQADAAEAFNDQLNSLIHTITGLTQQALLPLMPVLKGYLKLIQDWIFANKKLVQQDIVAFVKSVGEAILFLHKNARTILEVTKWLGGLIIAMRVFAGVMAIVNAVMDANPLSLIIIGIAGLVSGIVFLIAHFKKLRSVVLSVFHSLAKPFEALTKMTGTVLSPLANRNKALGIDVNHTSTGGHAANSNVSSPQVRVSKSISQNTQTNKSEVTIKDETGRAKLTGGKLGHGLIMQPSGAF